jgi:hypothetical protein
MSYRFSLPPPYRGVKPAEGKLPMEIDKSGKDAYYMFVSAMDGLLGKCRAMF